MSSSLYFSVSLLFFPLLHCQCFLVILCRSCHLLTFPSTFHNECFVHDHTRTSFVTFLNYDILVVLQIHYSLPLFLLRLSLTFLFCCCAISSKGYFVKKSMYVKIKAEDYERQFKTTDLQMISEIDDILQNSARLQKIAKEEWKRQCNVEEERSKTLWLEKKECYEKQEYEYIPDQETEYQAQREIPRSRRPTGNSTDLRKYGKNRYPDRNIRGRPFDDNRNYHRNQQVRPPCYQNENYIHAPNKPSWTIQPNLPF